MKHGNRLLKAAAGLMALAMTLPAFCSCETNIKPIEASEEEKKVIGTVGTYEICYDELRYVTLNTKEDMKATYGDTIWDSDESAQKYLPELENAVKERLASDYYAVKAMADYYYVGGSEAMFAEDSITEAVSEAINETAESCGGKKEYLAELEANYLNDRLYRFYTACDECATELLYVLKTDLAEIPSEEEDIRELLNSDKFIRTNHVFISGRTEESRALAEQVRETLLNSENPAMEIIILKGKYDADFTMTTTHGKYFARYTTDYGDAYEEAAFNLKVGGVSEVVEGTDGSENYTTGYFVILRLEKEDDYIEDNFDDFSDDMIGSEFNVKLNEFKAKLSFEFNDYGKTIDLLAIQ